MKTFKEFLLSEGPVPYWNIGRDFVHAVFEKNKKTKKDTKKPKVSTEKNTNC